MNIVKRAMFIYRYCCSCSFICYFEIDFYY